MAGSQLESVNTEIEMEENEHGNDTSDENRQKKSTGTTINNVKETTNENGLSAELRNTHELNHEVMDTNTPRRKYIIENGKHERKGKKNEITKEAAHEYQHSNTNIKKAQRQRSR
jgi:hypothetical protein